MVMTMEHCTMEHWKMMTNRMEGDKKMQRVGSVKKNEVLEKIVEMMINKSKSMFI